MIIAHITFGRLLKMKPSKENHIETWARKSGRGEDS